MFSDPPEHTEAVANPQPGDRYQEMYTFWIHVVDVTDQHVILVEVGSPGVVPNDATLRIVPKDKFPEAVRYVLFTDDENDFSGWDLTKCKKVEYGTVDDNK